MKLFADYFAGYEDHYVLIGGAACDVWLSKAEFWLRATKDLDLVLVIEAVDSAFIARFWSFIREGGYTRSEVSDGPRRCYRFAKPIREDFPFMLEFFSRSIGLLEQSAPGSIFPVAIDSSLSAISAIMLDDAVYSFILGTRRKESGLMVLDHRALIPLKAAAYVDLKTRRERGEHIDAGDIAKHRNDVLRLSVLLSEDDRIDVPDSLLISLRELLTDFEADKPDWSALRKSLGFPAPLNGDRLITL
ncbi:MAG: hypothetical protein ACYC6C_13350, partial [Coriobacteriia bacterium]